MPNSTDSSPLLDESPSNMDLLKSIGNITNTFSPSQKIISISLNGRNYPAWARAIRLFLGAKKKIDWLVTGKIVTPQELDPSYSDWFSLKCQILSWLINSMDTDIQDLFTFYETVDGLWSAVAEMYGTTNNSIRIYELHRELSHISQGSMTVTEYFGYLKKRWEELSSYTSLSSIEGMTPPVAVAIQKRDDIHRVHQFLMGLQSEYEAIRTQILNTVPAPSLGETYAMIEKHERRVTLSAKMPVVPGTPSSANEMAFMATTPWSSPAPSIPQSTGRISAPGNLPMICDHCQRPGHLIATCFSLHPELLSRYGAKKKWGPKSRTIIASDKVSGSSSLGASHDVAALTRQLNQVLHLFGEKSSIASTAISGTPSASLAASPGPWIFYSGANEHMTGNSGYSDEADFWQGV